jgi:hypothetical protein
VAVKKGVDMKKPQNEKWPKLIQGKGRSYWAHEDGSIQICDDLAELMVFAEREQLELDIMTSAFMKACQRIANSINTKRREFWETVGKDIIPETADDDADWQYNARTKRLRKSKPTKEST